MCNLHPGVDRNSMTYKIAMEAFNEISMTLPTEDRIGYRDAAMEAVTGPDTGMVLDRLYKGVNSRSAVNFGQIPASCGDITQFAKYKTISETMALLDRDIGDMRIEILKDAHTLHDNMLRLKPDFAYGFKTDTQFLKTTYNSMVYALCELLNLCIVVYVDILKAKVDNKTIKLTDYDNLMLVQNVRRFNKMVASGEWGQMTAELKKNGAAFGGQHQLKADSAGGLGGFIIDFVRSYGAGASVGTAGLISLSHLAKKDPSKTFGEGLKTALKSIWNSVPGKVIMIIAGVIMAVWMTRNLICLFWKATYGIRDILDDQVKLLEANAYSEQNSESASQKQASMLNMLTGLRDGIENRILKDDRNGKDEVAKANNEDLRKNDIAPTGSGEIVPGSDLDFG